MYIGSSCKAEARPCRGLTSSPAVLDLITAAPSAQFADGVHAPEVRASLLLLECGGQQSSRAGVDASKGILGEGQRLYWSSSSNRQQPNHRSVSKAVCLFV